MPFKDLVYSQASLQLLNRSILGRLSGVEPETGGSTTRCSTIKLEPPLLVLFHSHRRAPERWVTSDVPGYPYAVLTCCPAERCEKNMHKGSGALR